VIIALDIETIKIDEAILMLPEAKVKLGNTKDPAKVANKIAEVKAKQIEKAALNPLTARVVCYGMVGLVAPTHDGEQEHAEIVTEATDAGERVIIQSIMRILGGEEVRITTYNGVEFDMPMIYRRAIILGVDPANFGAPPLSAWTKRHSNDRHWDLQQIWSGWDLSKAPSLETMAVMVLGEHREDIPYDEIPELIKTEEGRKLVADGCLNHTRITWRLWKKFKGCLFA